MVLSANWVFVQFRYWLTLTLYGYGYTATPSSCICMRHILLNIFVILGSSFIKIWEHLCKGCKHWKGFVAYCIFNISFLNPLLANQCVQEEQLCLLRPALHPTSSKLWDVGLLTPSITTSARIFFCLKLFSQAALLCFPNSLLPSFFLSYCYWTSAFYLCSNTSKIGCK